MPRAPLERQARPGPSAPTSLALPLLMTLACGDGSLNDVHPERASTTASSTGDALPPIDSGEPGSTGAASTGEPEDDDPRLCPSDCYVDLPVDWVYQGIAPGPADGESEPPAPPEDPPIPPFGFDPQGHRVNAMIRDPEDGSLLVSEQRDGTVTLHRLDRHGRLEWNIPLPLPCDACELAHLAPHPSGDLLLSAAGLVLDGGFSLFASRYDPRAHTTQWVTSTPLQAHPNVPVRGGDIAALPDGTIAQLYLRMESSFNPLQAIWLVTYHSDGTVAEFNELDLGLPLAAHRPLLARASADGHLVVGIPAGQPSNPYGLLDHLIPPLWHSSFVSIPFAFDDLLPDDRGHTLELSHSFNGARVHLVLRDRAGIEPDPRWVASAAFDSVTDARAVLAVGPDGDAYAAMRTEQAPALGAEPLVGLAMARWTADGELRWQLTRLERLDPDPDTVRLAVDDDDGIIVATIVDDRLRVERRRQRCGCE